MIISDLNYLEVATEATVIGGNHNVSFNKNLVSNVASNTNFNNNTNINENFNKNANININSNVRGNSASLAFSNEAVGNNTNAQGAFSQLVVGGKVSSQEGLFVAAAN